MAPRINNFDVTSVGNASTNKLVKLMQFVSKPTCNGGGECVTTIYNYLPGLLVLLTVYIIIFFSLKLRGSGTLGAFTACNIVNLLLAIFLFPLGVISGQMLTISIMLIPISGFLLWMLKD